MSQPYEKEIKEVAGLAGEAMDAHTTALFLVEEPRRESLIMVAGVSPSTRLIPSAVIKMGHGLVGWVAKHGRPASASLKGEASNLLFYSGGEDIKSFAAAPIFDGQRLTGVLAVDSKSPDIFTDRQIKLLARFAATLGGMLIQGKRQSSLSAEASGIKALADLAESMAGEMGPEETLRLLRTRLPAIIPHNHLALAMRDMKTGVYEIIGGKGGGEAPFSLTQYRFGWVIHQARPIYLADVTAPVIPGEDGLWRSFIGAPIIAGGEVYGALGLLAAKPQAFRRNDTNSLTLVASMLAAALTAPALKECVRTAELTDPVTKTVFYRTLLEKRKDMAPSGALALIDLRGFKHVNKELSPRGGDNVLAQMADRLKKSLGSAGDICRYCADTFIVILPGATLGQAQAILTAALDSIESRPFHFGGVDAHITAIAGVASCPEDGKGAEELLLKAAESLAAVKKDPGRKILFHTDLHLVGLGLKTAL